MVETFVPEKTSNLVIRVKIDPNSEAPSETEQEMEFNPFTLSVLAVIILLLSSIAYYYFSSSDELENIALDGQGSETIMALDDPQLLGEPAMLTMEDADIAVVDQSIEVLEEKVVTFSNEPEIVDVSAPSIKNEHVDVVDVNDGSTPAIIKMLGSRSDKLEKQVFVGESQPAKIEDVASVETDNVPQSVNSTDMVTQSENLKNPAIQPRRAIDKELAIVPEITPTIAGYVKRAQFTNGIKAREPIDVVTGVIPAKREGIRRIYFFTELTELKGQVIRHQWFHGSKLKSELKFNVRGNRWRVNSSKRLNPAAAGEWRVNVVNERNDILLSETFSYEFEP